MRLSSCRLCAGQAHRNFSSNSFDSARVRPPLIDIQDATFYRRHPSSNPDHPEQHTNRALFPGLNFSLEADANSNQHCAIVGPSNAGKTTFLEILHGRHICYPPLARKYPFLGTDELLSKDRRLGSPARAIQYVGFDGKQKGLSGMGSYLSARFESRKEQTDFTLIDFLRGRTQLNSAEEYQEDVDQATFSKVVEDLRLESLLNMPTVNLSNGQTRRARIARALMGKPELLLLDEPFMGLDPPTTIEFNPLLRRLAYNCSPRILLALRPQDPIPDWVTDIIYLGEELQITHRGDRMTVTVGIDADFDQETTSVRKQWGVIRSARLKDLPLHSAEFGRVLFDEGISNNPWRMSKHNRSKFLNTWDLYKAGDRTSGTVQKLISPNGDEVVPQDLDSPWQRQALPAPPVGDALLEMDGVSIKYDGKPALGDWQEQLQMCDMPGGNKVLVRDQHAASKPGLQLTVKRGQRWGIIGPNGSGKTTLLSLITSDHPQAYSAPIKLFGRSRLPEPGRPGLSLFEIQSRIGQSSPEVHSFFPRHLSVRRTLESAWADTPLGKPKMPYGADAHVEACLRWFQEDLNPVLGPHPRLEDEMLTAGRIPPDIIAPGGFWKDGTYKRGHNARSHWYDFAEREKAAVEWADDKRFSEMTFSGQRVALFLRAIIAKPDIVILDEALSGLDETVRDKCLLFLEHGENRMATPYNESTISQRKLSHRDRRLGWFKSQMMTVRDGLSDDQALIVVSHVPREIPRSVRDWIFLPASGTGAPAITGEASTVQLRSDTRTWSAIWRADSLPVLSRSEYDGELAKQSEVLGPDGHDRSSTDKGMSLAEIERLVIAHRSMLSYRRRKLRQIEFHLENPESLPSSRARRIRQIEQRSKRSEAKQARHDLSIKRKALLRVQTSDRDLGLLHREVERRLGLIRNRTSYLKGVYDEFLKQRGEAGFERYRRGGYADRPTSVEDAELSLKRNARRFRQLRGMVRQSAEKILGKEAMPAFDARHHLERVRLDDLMSRQRLLDGKPYRRRAYV